MSYKHRLTNLSGQRGSITNEKFELIPNINQIYELELAILEFTTLKHKDKINRLSYFKSVDKKDTIHYQMCNQTNLFPITLNKRKSNYFKQNQYALGYATHGLFPYKGKFHEQMVRSILNIIGVDSSSVILDPMAGSGTTNIESALLGIDSIAIDINPFSQFLIEIKYDLLIKDNTVFNDDKINLHDLYTLFEMQSGNGFLNKELNKKNDLKFRLYSLAYYFTKSHQNKFKTENSKQLYIDIIDQYANKLSLFHDFKKNHNLKIGNVKVLKNASATNIKIRPGSIDGIVTSPPYTDMINYPYNDSLPLHRMGYNPIDIQCETIGLKGSTKNDRIKLYLEDMNKLFSESNRVLKENKYLVMVIGYKESDLKTFDLKEKILNCATSNGFALYKLINKPINGYKNKLSNEEILFFQKSKM